MKVTVEENAGPVKRAPHYIAIHFKFGKRIFPLYLDSQMSIHRLILTLVEFLALLIEKG